MIIDRCLTPLNSARAVGNVRWRVDNSRARVPTITEPAGARVGSIIERCAHSGTSRRRSRVNANPLAVHQGKLCELSRKSIWVGYRSIRTLYEADLQVVDRYQSFSSELLRLSLLGITGYGFLIANIVLKATKNPEQYMLLGPWTVSALIIGAVALGLCAATALGHRYFSTDCITHFVRRLRATKRSAALPEGNDERETLVQTGTPRAAKFGKGRRVLSMALDSFKPLLGVGCGMRGIGVRIHSLRREGNVTAINGMQVAALVWDGVSRRPPASAPCPERRATQRRGGDLPERQTACLPTPVVSHRWIEIDERRIVSGVTMGRDPARAAGRPSRWA